MTHLNIFSYYETPKKCEQCGKIFYSHKNNKIFCTRKCRQTHLRAAWDQKVKYYVFDAIKQRCSNPHNIHYSSYGACNIQCLITWEDFQQIYCRTDTCEICGKKFGTTQKDKKSLERINPTGNYEVSNLLVICMECNGARAKLSWWLRNGYKLVKDANEDIK